MYNVAIAEQRILNDNLRYKPNLRFGGWSECLVNSVNLRDYISSNEVDNLTQEELQT
jgi:hypothetical protein